MDNWVLGPVGHDADGRVTRRGCRTVLAMVPTVTAGNRLADVIPLLESDHRIQVVFTVPRQFDGWQGPEEFVRRQHGLLFPWPQATQYQWDLVLSASHREISRVHGNVLVLPHGATAAASRTVSRKAGGGGQPTTGLDRELLTYRGRVIPAALAIPHEAELAVLADRCPEAVPRAVVTGDIALDRLVANRSARPDFRRCLGVTADQTLITISSTWWQDSVFGRHLDMYRRLLAELPPRAYRVAAILHPQIWQAHGAWQVRAWLADCRRAGLLIIPPEQGWQATLIASDWLIGDHGSVTLYGAALGLPTTLAAYPDGRIRAGSAAAELAGVAPRIDHRQPLLPQLRTTARHHSPDIADHLTRVVTSRPRRAAATLRTTMYRLLGLPEPAWPAESSPLARPGPDPRTAHFSE